MARPKKERGALRAGRIAFRLTEAENMQIEEAARKAEMTPSEYARMQALEGRVIVSQNRTLDAAVFDELRRIGVNLNQLTRLAHVKENMPPELPRLCEQLERFLSREIDGYDPESRG